MYVSLHPNPDPNTNSVHVVENFMVCEVAVLEGVHFLFRYFLGTHQRIELVRVRVRARVRVWLRFRVGYSPTPWQWR